MLPSNARETAFTSDSTYLELVFIIITLHSFFQAARENSPIRHLKPFHSLLFPNQTDSTRLSSALQRFKILNFLSPAEA